MHFYSNSTQIILDNCDITTATDSGLMSCNKLTIMSVK